MAQSATSRKNALRVLVVNNDPVETQLVLTALDELTEIPSAHQLLIGRPIDSFHAGSADEAIPSLKRTSYDLILIDLSAGADPAMELFLHVQTVAGRTPIVVTAAEEDENVALFALRHGAAGYLLREQLDCFALARAMRVAVEHELAIEARRVDQLSGLLTRNELLREANLIERIAMQCNLTLLLVSITLQDSPAMRTYFGDQGDSLAILEASEMVREVFGDATIVARTGEREFLSVSVGKEYDALDAHQRIKSWREQKGGTRASESVMQYDVREDSVKPESEAIARYLDEAGDKRLAFQSAGELESI